MLSFELYINLLAGQLGCRIRWWGSHLTAVSEMLLLPHGLSHGLAVFLVVYSCWCSWGFMGCEHD